MIACDTSALSQFLRRSPDTQNDVALKVEKLIDSNELALFGIVRQELLSGIKLPAHFERIDLTTQALPLFFADDEDHTTAARFFNTCRAKGIQGSPIDFLICAMAVKRKFRIYTTDPDFELYEPIIPIELYRP
ncbi:MAG: PIN domain-containing protein [Chthoniobacterales bacterium]|jgi:predicted nucleic acid-binding protein|nr:PIN domain-containing protein [Chthoniobacterales bacterium]